MGRVFIEDGKELFCCDNYFGTTHFIARKSEFMSVKHNHTR